MSSRQDKQREAELQPVRMKTALKALEKKTGAIELHQVSETEIQFHYKWNKIRFWPYSGWHSGKGIKAGRGLQNLLKQI